MRDFSIDLVWAKIQGAITVIGGWLGYFLGGLDGLMIALVVFVILDYVTGIMCAINDRKLSSAVGFRGICRKVLIFLLVGVAHIVDLHVVGSGSALRGAVVCSTALAAAMMKHRSWCNGSCRMESASGASRKASRDSTAMWISCSITSVSGRRPVNRKRPRSAFAPSSSKWCWRGNIRCADRAHAIGLGKLYLQLYKSKFEWRELKDIFQNWNIDKGSAFIKQDAKDIVGIGVDGIISALRNKL